MTPEFVLSVGRQAVEKTLLVSAPILIVSLVVGLIVSVFQTATQINEQTLTFVPKIIAVFVAGVLFSSFMLSTMVEYLTTVLTNIPNYVS